MSFYLRVYDNYHYMDDSEAYNHGTYGTCAEALAAAKAIVEEFFIQNWKPGITAQELRSQYSMFGEDPVILSNGEGDCPPFSAWNYATEIQETIFKKLEGGM